MHEVAGGFAQERVAVIGDGQVVAVKESNTASRSDEAGVERGRGNVGAQRIDTAGWAMVGDVFDLQTEWEVRIASEVFELHDYLLDVIAVRANELAAEFIEALPELSGSGVLLEVIGSGTETAI